MQLDIRDFGEFEAAFAEFVTDHVLRIMNHHGITKHYDGAHVKRWLTEYVDRTLDYIRGRLREKLQAVTPAYMRAGHDVAITMPRITRTCASEDLGLIGTLFDDYEEVYAAISDEVEEALKRTMRFTVSFRFVRKSAGHTFTLANVNAVLEEVGAGGRPARYAAHIPFSIDEPEDEEDETLPRGEVEQTWLRNYTLVEDRFELGRTLTITATDIYKALQEDDSFALMLRALLGLGNEHIDNIEVTGTLHARLYDQKGKVVNLA